MEQHLHALYTAHGRSHAERMCHESIFRTCVMSHVQRQRHAHPAHIYREQSLRSGTADSRPAHPTVDHSTSSDVSATIWSRGMLSLGVSLRVYILGRLAVQKTCALDMAATGLCTFLSPCQPVVERCHNLSCACSCVKKAEKLLLCGEFSSR